MLVSSESGAIYVQIKNRLQAKSDLNMLVDFDVRGLQGIDFFTGGSIIMDYFYFFRELFL